MPAKTLKSKNFYAYNAISAARLNFSPNYSYLITKLIQIEQDLALGVQVIDNLSKNILSIINHSDAFPNIDRVCLSLTYPGSSRISVLSSYNNENLANNRMDPGYSCYVSSDSSIFKTKQTHIRIYSDIEEIIKLYDEKPVQRSLGLLQKMGIKSGITLPLGITPMISAFLFMNSASIGAFNYLNKEDYACLSLLKLVTTNVLNRLFLGDYGIDGQIGKYLHEQKQLKNTFDDKTFIELLKNAIQLKFKRTIDIEFTNKVNKSFLYAYNPLIYAIIKILSFCETPYEKINLKFEEKIIDSLSYVKVSLEEISLNDHHLQSFNEIKLFTNQDMIIGQPCVQMFSKLDETQLADYSI